MHFTLGSAAAAACLVQVHVLHEPSAKQVAVLRPAVGQAAGSWTQYWLVQC